MATRERKDRRGRSRWQIRWYDSLGKECTYTLPVGSTKRDAAAKEREILQLRAAGVDWRPAHREAAPATIRRVMDGWVTYRRGVVRSKHTVATEASGVKMFLHWLEEVYGQPDPAAAKLLTKGLLQGFYAWLLAPVDDGGRQVGDAHAARCVGYIRRAWEWAYESGEHPGTPPAPSKIETRKPIRKRTIAPTWEQVDAVVASIADPEVRKAVVLMRFTGLRVSQVLRLRWDDVDLEDGWMVIRPELGKTANERAGREIPMSPHLVAELAGWGPREGLIVRTNYQKVHDHVSRAWKTSGLPPALYRRRPNHAFRKAIESGCKAAKVDRDAIEYFVGHDLGTYGVYVDPDDLDLVSVAEAIPALGAGGNVKSIRGRRRKAQEG